MMLLSDGRLLGQMPDPPRSGAELERLFPNPPAAFRPMPFFVWNGEVTEADIDRQLADYKSQGLGGFFVHPRVGLITPYLSERWFELFRYTVEKAKQMGLQAWLYDENPFPSGAAGGHTAAEMPASYNQGSGLILHRLPSRPAAGDSRCRFLIEKPTGGCDCFELAYFRPRGARGYVDLLVPGVTEKFLEITMRGYEKSVGNEFGKAVPGIFTDEPNTRAPGRRALKWTPDLSEQFRKRRGYDVEPLLAAMFEETGDWRRVRHDYNLTVLELFIERWSKPWLDYTEKKGLLWTGHYWDHGWPAVDDGPDNMAMYPYHQLPGVDLLFNQYDEEKGDQFGDVRIVKELSSVANQFGRKRALSETYGGSGWELRFEDMKRLGDWEYVLGVNFMNQHLTYQTLAGVRKYDWPQSFGSHDPWWKHYHVQADYFARLSLALSAGEQINRILVLEPTTTAWMYAGGGDPDSRVHAVEEAFRPFLNQLEKLQVEYDLGCENILRSHGQIKPGQLIVGNRSYDLVIVPPGTENLDSPTVGLIEKYLSSGGLLLSFVDPPPRVDGAESARLRDLAARYGSRWLRAASTDDPIAIQHLVTGEFEVTAGKLYHQRRKLADRQLLFFVNSSVDTPAQARVRTAGRSVQVLDAFTGRAKPYPARAEKDKLAIQVTVPPVGSLLLVISPEGTPAPAAREAEEEHLLSPAGPMTVRRNSSNVIKIDYCDLKLGDTVEEDLPIHAALEKVYRHHGFEANPWWSPQYKTEFLDRDHFADDSGFEATFHFDIEEGLDLSKVQAVVERPRLWRVLVNGAAVSPLAGKWWLDPLFGVYEIGDRLKPGSNTVTVEAKPMSIHAELQPVYILGEFGAAAQEKGFRIVKPRTLGLGAWSAQDLPFYSEGVVYSRVFRAEGRKNGYKLRLGKWLGTVAEVRVNGRSAGIIGWPPYELDLSGLVTEGQNEVEVEVLGSLKNLLGPHHGKFNPGLIGSWLWRTAPEHTPPGAQYNLIGYGLFEDFQIAEVR